MERSHIAHESGRPKLLVYLPSPTMRKVFPSLHLSLVEADHWPFTRVLNKKREQSEQEENYGWMYISIH